MVPPYMGRRLPHIYPPGLVPTPQRPLVTLKEGGGNALLHRSVDDLRDIVWGCGGGGVDEVGIQDGGVAAEEGVVLVIVPVVGHRQDEAPGGGRGHHGGCGRPAGKEEGSKLLASLTGFL